MRIPRYLTSFTVTFLKSAFSQARKAFIYDDFRLLLNYIAVLSYLRTTIYSVDFMTVYFCPNKFCGKFCSKDQRSPPSPSMVSLSTNGFFIKTLQSAGKLQVHFFLATCSMTENDLEFCTFVRKASRRCLSRVQLKACYLELSPLAIFQRVFYSETLLLTL